MHPAGFHFVIQTAKINARKKFYKRWSVLKRLPGKKVIYQWSKFKYSDLLFFNDFSRFPCDNLAYFCSLNFKKIKY